MAKIIVAGEAVVITSGMKLADLETIKKYNPKALVLMGGEDGKEPVFCIGVNRGKTGSINQYGAEFGSETRDDQKLATMTLMTSGVTGDVKEFVADKYGAALMQLNKLEATLPAALEAIAADKKAILDNITVSQ